MKFEIYEHDDDLCARGCGVGCTRNTHAAGYADAAAYYTKRKDDELAKALKELAALKRRVKLVQKLATLATKVWDMGAESSWKSHSGYLTILMQLGDTLNLRRDVSAGLEATIKSGTKFV